MIPTSPVGVLLLLWSFLAAPPAAEPSRMVGIGDLHGDLAATRAVLRMVGAIDERDRWIGGRLIVVQTGDLIDRGSEDRAVIDLLEKVRAEAPAAGGQLIVLNGNHELMNVRGNFGYVADAAWKAFDDLPVPESAEQALPRWRVPPEGRARAAAFLPGGVYAKILADHPMIVVVDGVVFAHGGVLPKHARYGVERINAEVSAWLRGERPAPAVVSAPDSPWWSRHYSKDPDARDCKSLRRSLRRLGARRMVVGHTPVKRGISSACDGLVWRIDCGLSAHYGGPLQALEMRGDAFRVIGEGAAGSAGVTAPP